MADPVEAAAEAIAAQAFQDMGLPTVQWQTFAETVKAQYRVYAKAALAAADAARLKDAPEVARVLNLIDEDICRGAPHRAEYWCLKAAALITAQAARIEALEAEKYLIWSNEHDAWWRSNRCGYTTILAIAGRYTREEAISICAHARDGFAVVGAPSEIMVREADVGESAVRSTLEGKS